MNEHYDKLPPKKKMLYQAVIDLANDGADINRLKVSDITNRAGIGKGTAYEYFSSKEEIIAEAFVYNLHSCAIKAYDAIKQRKTFYEKIYFILDRLEEDFQTRKSVAFYLNIDSYTNIINENIKEEILQNLISSSIFQDSVKDIMDAAYQENIVKHKLEDIYSATAIVSQIVGFMVYLNVNRFKKTVGSANMKDFIYSSIIKSMN